jgi:hypothetical protein
MAKYNEEFKKSVVSKMMPPQGARDQTDGVQRISSSS